ncbi:hypothetical protein [Burkholderia ubonensis]|uniref:hypothetical protein n=1 Tax=Burkholderia ubonensis TaxID=101571 RepID=UPI003F750495
MVTEPPVSSASYQPRDVVNAPDIKAAIARRSAERGDPADISAWLANHFFRWIIGGFEQARPLHSLADYRAVAGADQPAPEWLVRRFMSRAATTRWSDRDGCRRSRTTAYSLDACRRSCSSNHCLRASPPP